MLKNMTTQRYINLMRINADRRILLTGTPLQNNLLELMSLLCFVMPTLFAGNADDLKTLFQKSTTVSGFCSNFNLFCCFSNNFFHRNQQKVIKPMLQLRMK